MKKILFTDLDGTFLNDDKSINLENKVAVERMVKSGGYFAIATGRPLATAKTVIDGLGFDFPNYYAVTYNGALIYDCYKKETIFERTIPKAVVSELFNLVRENGLYVQTYEDDLLLGSAYDDNLLSYTGLTPMKAKGGKDVLKYLSHDPNKCIMVEKKDTEKLAWFAEEFKDFFPANNLTASFSNDNFLEITPMGATKDDGNARLADILCVDNEDVVACGDERNDISMIRAAGLGVAVQNAKDEVKAVADFITERTNNEGAIAEVIEKFF